MPDGGKGAALLPHANHQGWGKRTRAGMMVMLGLCGLASAAVEPYATNATSQVRLRGQGYGRRHLGQSSSSTITFNNGRVPPVLSTNGIVTVPKGNHVLRLADYTASSDTHVFTQVSKALGLPSGLPLAQLSVALTVKVSCANPSKSCGRGYVSFMLYAPGDAGSPHPDSGPLTLTGLTARLSLANDTDQAVLNGQYIKAQGKAHGRLHTGLPMLLSWDSDKGLGYKSGVTTCQDECANRLPNGRPLPASLLLKPTTDWIFRVSAYPEKDHEMQVDITSLSVSAVDGRRDEDADDENGDDRPHKGRPTKAPTLAPTPAPTRGVVGAQCMRVRVLANRGQARDVQFSEWHFMGNDGSFIEPVEVTAAGGWWPPDQGLGPPSAVDDNTDTKYYNSDAFASSWTVKFASPQMVGGYAWATADDMPGRDPVAWAIDWSQDCDTWVNAYDVRAYQEIPEARRTWAGTWWFRSSCYVQNPLQPPTRVQAQCMRVRVLQSSGAPDVQWSEWWFVDGQGKKLLPSAVLSNGGGDAKTGADNDLSTKYYNPRALTTAWTVRFPSPQSVAGYTWATANDAVQRDPVRWAVDASADCSTWTHDVHVIKDPQAVTHDRGAWAGSWWFKSACNRPNVCNWCGPAPAKKPPTQMKAQCFRVRVLSTKAPAKDVHWSEWWFTAPNGTKLTPSGVTATGWWPSDQGLDPHNAADGDLSTNYYNTDGINSVWVAKFDASVVVGGYTWATASLDPTKDPTGWVIDYSPDCVTDFTGGLDVRTRQVITDARSAWAGSWSLATSCYLNRGQAGCCGCV